MVDNYSARCVATGTSILILVAMVVLGYFTVATTAVLVFFALGPAAVIWGAFPRGIRKSRGWHRHYVWLMLGGGFSLAAVAAVKATCRRNL